MKKTEAEIGINFHLSLRKKVHGFPSSHSFNPLSQIYPSKGGKFTALPVTSGPIKGCVWGVGGVTVGSAPQSEEEVITDDNMLLARYLSFKSNSYYNKSPLLGGLRGAGVKQNR